MLRSESRLDPEVVAELERLDAVLAGDREADPLLALLAEDVAATRPRLSADARARLEARTDAVRVRAARPRKAVWRSRLERPAWRRGLALAAVAAVAVPVVGGLALNQTRDEPTSVVSQSAESTSGMESQAKSSPDGSGPQLDAGRSSSAALPPQSGRAASERRVVRDVRQTVRVAPGEVAGATARITTIVGDAGGYLASSEVRERGASAGGTFEVVVPSAQLDATVARLSRVGRLVRLERSSRDVTDQAASLDDRLKDVRADRAALRLQLARTVDPQRRAARRRELRVLSSRVARLEGERRSLRQQTDTTRIGLRLTTASAAAAGPSDDDEGWGLAQAWRDAGRVLEVVAGGLLVGAAVIVPVALVALGGILLRRRRRRAAGDRLIDGA